MYLKAGYTGQRPLRGTNICRIIGECTDVIPYCCRHVREDVTGQLHTVAGIAGEAYYHLLQFFNHHFVCHNFTYYFNFRIDLLYSCINITLVLVTFVYSFIMQKVSQRS